MAIMMHDQPLRRRALDFKNLEAAKGSSLGVSVG